MSLHLLHHKDWHVWKKDNLAIVEKDEKEHQKKLDEERSRQIAVEREGRYERLSGKKVNVQTPEPETETETENVNFFSDIERMIEKNGMVGVKPNPEYEKEKKEKQAKLERQTTSYLGQGAIETQKDKPWWFGSAEKDAVVDEKKAKREAYTKRSEDPFTHVGMLMEIKKAQKKEKTKSSSTSKSKKRRREAESDSDSDDSKKKKKRKSDQLSGHEAQLLRAERIQREKEEDERVKRLMAKASKSAPATPTPRRDIDEQIPFYSTARRYEKGGGRIRGDQ